MAKKAAVKKAPVNKVTPKKKLPPKKKEPIIAYDVVRTIDDAIVARSTFSIGDKVYNSSAGSVTTIRGIYTNGKIVKYHLNTGVYVTEDILILQ
jgi:hypothetical protein